MSEGQGFLFGDMPEAAGGGPIDLAPRALALRSLAHEIPPEIHLGTSSWSFPSWAGLVYGREHAESMLAREGLRAYARHPLFRAVGLDRTFYRPMDARGLARLAGMTPADFRFLVKAHGSLTKPGDPLFLDAAWMRDQVMEPARSGLGDRLGVVLLQFPPMDLRGDRASRWVDRLAGFIGRLPTGVPCAVEVRNAEVLAPGVAARFIASLAPYGWEPCFTGHPTMPPIEVQQRAWEGAGWSLDRPSPTPVVARWLLHPTKAYEEARDAYYPFHELPDAHEEARRGFGALAVGAWLAGRGVIVIVNNKAEGSAPRSVEELAAWIASGIAARRARWSGEP